MNRTIEDWLPPVAYRALRRLASDIRFSRYPRKDVLQPNLKIKGQGGGRRAFLLATGPSLKREDLTLLAGEDCFSISNFFLHDDIDVVRPSYHFFAPYHAPLVLENYIDWLREADRRLPLNTAIVLGHSGLPLVEKYLLFPERTIYYLYLSESVSLKRVDLLKPVMTPQTGTIMILPFLIYMGYSEIYLLGCDHNVLRNYGGRVENFYQASQEIRENATNEKSWVGIVDTHASSMRVFQQYGFYKRIFDQKGILVKNLSRGSWLDSFPFDDLENIVKSDFA